MRNPLDIDGLRARVQAGVDTEIAAQSAVLAELGEDLSPLLGVISSLLQGGKRLRAAFLYWGYRAAGGPDSDALVRAATAMELFQAAALLHDDLMDDSDTRRGMPAAHRRLARHHRDAGWVGSSERFGLSGAILAGDLCLTWTDEMFSTCGLPPAEMARARPVFDRMRTQLMGGQFLDVMESARRWDGLSTDERVDRARRVIAFKSAKYTVEHPLLIGASAWGASEADQRTLAAYGLGVGEAFQLRDDLLGVFGDSCQTGKPAGDDLREGKRTVLVAYALDMAEPASAGLLQRLLGLAEMGDADVAELREAITRSGAVERVEKLIDRLVVGAHESLASTSGLTGEGRAALEALVEISTARTS